MAWLNATPEESKESRRAQLLSHGEGSPFLELPFLPDEQYLIEWWHEVGTVGQGGMGIIPLSWQEIRAWRQENELELENFELNMIRLLSVEYCGEYHAASAKNRPAPYSIEEDEIDREAVSNRIGSVLRSLIKNSSEPKYTVEE